MGVKELVVGGILTIVIGGTAYTVNKEDVAVNLAEDTGMSERQAQDYIEGLKDEDLQTFDKIGQDLIKDGNVVLTELSNIDCTEYTYEWETPTLDCRTGKIQMSQLGQDEIALGNVYLELSSDHAGVTEMNSAIRAIDRLLLDYDFEVVNVLLDQATLTESINAHSYNKALIKTILEEGS